MTSAPRRLINRCVHCGGTGWEFDGPCPHCKAAVTRFCDEFLEVPSDPWAGTYCKLLVGHAGEHSAHYPAAPRKTHSDPEGQS